MQAIISEILRSVRSPYRYAGGEALSRAKDWDGAQIRICLAFPDVYEIGMSHLGLSILYHIVNDRPDMLAERAFAPWADMEAELAKRGMPLFSIESHRALREFDIVGFSLAYELTYTNVLTMLKLAGIPLRASERDDSHPLVIAGGPCAFNPMPVAPFFDAIVIGDGEDAILEIARAVREAKAKRSGRGALLDKLANRKGIYVPRMDVSIDHRPSTIGVTGKAHIQDLNSAPFPALPVIPHAATQERLAVEVSRGCARGCRFCQAGYIYRPVRQRSGSAAVKIACGGLTSTGAEEFSFLSLSVGDWVPLENSLKAVHENMKGMPVNASLPSLRAESLTGPVILSLGKGRAGSFTLAPEASTERMRRFINKGNTDEDLYRSVEKIFQSGFHAIKLYFMIGLPGETEDEIEGIVKISNKCLDIGRRFHRRPEITVSTSTFVPKAHTPFQWDAQITIAEAERIQNVLKKRLRRPGLFYRWHDAGTSFLEGVFSRGGAELSRAIEIAHENGARFDGWDECFNLERWMAAFAEAEVDPVNYLNGRGRDEKFPWEFLGAGPSRKFLLRERERAQGLLATPDCTTGPCSGCGICDGNEIKNFVIQDDCHSPGCGRESSLFDSGLDTRLKHSGTTCRYRLRYKKTGRAAFLGSIETLDALRRSFRMSGLSLCYTEGYHPRAKVSSGPALPVGIESEAEFIDVELSGPIDETGLVGWLRGALPGGMEIVEAKELPAGAPPIEEAARLVRYEITLPEGAADMQSACDRFGAAEKISFRRVRGEKVLDVDLKEYVEELAVLHDNVLGIGVRNVQPRLKISEVLSAVLNVDVEDVKLMLIKKVEVMLR